MSVDRDDDPELPERHEQAPVAQERAPDGTDAPGLRERQLAENACYQKAVDAAYQQAARDAWARAAPELRAAWEDHKQRYPEQVRPAAQTQPDGSWAGDGGRRLTPEQNAEATKCCADLRDEADHVIRPALQRIESAEPIRQLAGLENIVKGEDRLKEKLADAWEGRPHLTVRQVLGMIPDIVRSTLTYSSESYADGVVADIDRLKAEGFELIKLKNLWQADQYKGINSQWRRSETGTRFEMQFHTPESLAAKELTHEAYERLRSAAALPAHERELTEERRLEDFQRKVNALIATPPGTDRIKNFPEK